MKFLSSIFSLLLILGTLAGCDSPEDKLANYLERGNKLFKEEAYIKARLEYKNAAKIDPTSAEVRYRLGLLDEATGDIRNAYANFIQAEQQDKNHYPSIIKLAQYYMASNQLEEAIHKLDSVFKAEPNNPNAIAILAAVKLRQGKIKESEKEALRALSLDKKNITAVAVLTGLYQKTKEINKAEEILEEGIKNNPTDSSLLLLKAALFKKEKNFLKIKEAYKTLFILKPKDISFRLAYAQELYGEKKIKETEAFLRDTVNKFPDNLAAKKQLLQYINNEKGLEPTEQLIKAYIAQNKNEEQFYFWLADLYISHKNSEKAAALLQEIVEQEKDSKLNLNAQASLARINITKGNRDLAEKLIATVLEKEPSHLESLYIRANLSFKDGAYQKAIGDLRTIIRDNPKAQNAYQLLAETLLLQGRINLAIDTLAQLIQTNPNANLAVRVRLAQMFEASGNPQQGLALLKTVTNTDPNYPYGWETTARLALTAKELKLAETAISKIEDINGYELTALFLKGQLLALQGEKDKATILFKSILQKAKEQPIAEHALEAFSKVTKTNELVSFLNSIEPKSAYIYNALGDSYLTLKNIDQATNAYDLAIASNPHKAEPYISRAKIYVKNKDYDKALNLLEKAMTIDPSNFIAPIISAEVLTSQKKYDQAIARYDSILSRNADVHAAANNMADLIANKFPNDTAKLEKARLVAERFISSDNPFLLDTLAWVYYKTGKTQQALTIIQRAIAIQDKLSPIINYHYGKILFDTNNKKLAKEQLSQALKSGQNFEGKEDAKKLLKLIE